MTSIPEVSWQSAQVSKQTCEIASLTSSELCDFLCSFASSITTLLLQKFFSYYDIPGWRFLQFGKDEIKSLAHGDPDTMQFFFDLQGGHHNPIVQKQIPSVRDIFYLSEQTVSVPLDMRGGEDIGEWLYDDAVGNVTVASDSSDAFSASDFKSTSVLPISSLPPNDQDVDISTADIESQADEGVTSRYNESEQVAVANDSDDEENDGTPSDVLVDDVAERPGPVDASSLYDCIFGFNIVHVAFDNTAHTNVITQEVTGTSCEQDRAILDRVTTDAFIDGDKMGVDANEDKTVPVESESDVVNNADEEEGVQQRAISEGGLHISTDNDPESDSWGRIFPSNAGSSVLLAHVDSDNEDKDDENWTIFGETVSLLHDFPSPTIGSQLPSGAFSNARTVHIPDGNLDSIQIPHAELFDDALLSSLGDVSMFQIHTPTTSTHNHPHPGIDNSRHRSKPEQDHVLFHSRLSTVQRTPRRRTVGTQTDTLLDPTLSQRRRLEKEVRDLKRQLHAETRRNKPKEWFQNSISFLAGGERGPREVMMASRYLGQSSEDLSAGMV